MKTGKTSQVVSNILNTPFLRNLFIASLVVSVIFPTYSVFVIIPSFNNQLTKNTEDDAVRTASYLENLIIKEKAEFTKDSLSNEVISEIGKVKEAFRLEELKIFSKQGEIIFSTTPKDIGEKNTNDYFFNIVAKGNIYTKVARKDTKSLEGRIVTADVVETYVPMLSNDTFIGAFEIYYDITRRKKNLDNLLAIIYSVMFAIALILMVTVVFILFKASKNILAREQAEVALQKAHDGLEIKVNERTADFKKSNEELLNEIAERKRAEKALKESENRFRDIVHSMADWIWEVDKNGKYTYVSDTVIRVLGYSAEELIGKTPFALMSPQEEAKIKAIFHEIISRSGPIVNLVSWNLAKDGTEVCLLTNGVPIMDADGEFQGYRGVDKDITRQKKLEAENAAIEAQLRQSQKMEAIGTLAGGIAHDFNNILSAVIGYTELAQMKLESDSEIKSDLKEVLTASNRAKNLVRQILAFSRQTQKEQMPVQMGLIVKEALKLLRSSLPVTIDMHQNIQSKSVILSDPTQIHQIVMNLCTNAAHAMREKGGILEITLTDVELDSDFASTHLEIQPGAYQKLTVSDTGQGMTADVMNQIFDPFFTTKEKGEGTGLGLSVVHGIVKDCGGTVMVYSEPDKGTTFNLYFPIIKDTAEEKPGEYTIIPTGTEHILFVDDEKPIIDIAKRILVTLGYVVEVRASSLEALELFKVMPAKFDLVITDMTMPQMTGDALARELMKIRPDLPVILCTGFSKKITKEKAEIMGIKAFLMKPLLKEEMAHTIRKVLDEAKA